MPVRCDRTSLAEQGPDHDRFHNVTTSTPRPTPAELRRELDALLDVWFPRVVDAQHSGFLCDFDHRWRAVGPHTKALEFQARMVRTLCASAEFLPERPELAELAGLGAEYLRDVMWDNEYGGFFRCLERAGTPLEGGSKHLHGTSYAIAALVAHDGISGDSDSLDRARSGFDWLETHARDEQNGGYFTVFDRSGDPILTPDDAPPGFGVRDVIGTPFGYKDANSTCDLMVALVELGSAAEMPFALERGRELFQIALEKLVAPPGSMHMFTSPDWRPVPDYARYGQNLHAANLLRETAQLLGADAEDRARDPINALVENALAHAWDSRHGGFCFAGSSFGQAHLDRDRGSLGEKYWWVQAEGLVALTHRAMAGRGRGSPDGRPLRRLWDYIRDNVIDARRGGWHWVAGEGGRPPRRAKSSPWKDPSHEVRGLIECIRVLESRDRE